MAEGSPGNATALEDRSWADDAQGQPLTPRHLATLLEGFRIKANQIRQGADTRNGTCERTSPTPSAATSYGLAAAKWERRAEVLRAAYAAHPERFPRGASVPPPLPTAAWINKPAAAVPTIAVPEGVGS